MFNLITNNNSIIKSNSQSNLITNSISQKRYVSTITSKEVSPRHQAYINAGHKRASHPFHMVDPSI
jgi:hypothetical protein